MKMYVRVGGGGLACWSSAMAVIGVLEIGHGSGDARVAGDVEV